MTPELTYLVWSVALLLVHVVVQASAGTLALGLPYAASNQDEQREPDSHLVRRIHRALKNFLETYPAFIALVFLITTTGEGTGMTAMGAALWFWARIAYVIVYAIGVPFLRTLIWFASFIGLVMMLLPMLPF